MIVVLSPDRPPQLTDLDRLDRLHATCDGPVVAAQLGELCAADDDDHVWLDVTVARSIGVAASDDSGFGDQFDGMIAYASSAGWLNDAGTHVRAHIDHAGGATG